MEQIKRFGRQLQLGLYAVAAIVVIAAIFYGLGWFLANVVGVPSEWMPLVVGALFFFVLVAGALFGAWQEARWDQQQDKEWSEGR